MQKPPDDFCAQSCRKLFSGPLRSGRAIIIAPLLFLLILPSAPAQTRRWRPGAETLAPAQSQPPPNGLAATPVEQWDLKVSRQKVRVGESVSFEVRPSSKSENIEYRFYFGDGSETDWTTEPHATHQYRWPKTFYVAYADVRLRMVRDREITAKTVEKKIDVVDVLPSTPTPTSVKTGVGVTPSPHGTHSETTVAPSPTATPVIPWPERLFRWRYRLLGGLLVVVLAYLLRKIWVIPPPPTFHPHWDHGTPQTKRQENIAINYELHFDPNLFKGEHELDTLGSDLVTPIKEEP